MGGWMGGRQSRFKDCLQKKKIGFWTFGLSDRLKSGRNVQCPKFELQWMSENLTFRLTKRTKKRLVIERSDFGHSVRYAYRGPNQMFVFRHFFTKLDHFI